MEEITSNEENQQEIVEKEIDCLEEDEYEEDTNDEEDEMESVVTANGELIDPLKKRRGRKPKPRDEEKTQKKRGRKPKPKEEGEEDDKYPKKRGRKPKEKVYCVKDEFEEETLSAIEKSETIILHLPIKKDGEEIVEPSPYLKKNINYSMISSTYSVVENIDMNHVKMVPKVRDEMIKDEEEDENQEVKNNDDYDINFSLLDLGVDGEEEIEQNVEEKKVEKKMEKEEKLEKEEKEEKEEKLEIRMNEDDYRPNKIIKKNLKNIMYEFVNSNVANTWPESTNTHCWWCCHQFTGMPCALPEIYRKDKFYVSGVFCSFNCAASYNFSKNDGEEMWMRYSLLNLMYKKMYANRFVKIGLAPPREVLKMFGGYMCIDEFRETCLKMDRTFNVIKPPLVAIIPKIEENILHRGIKTGATNEHILNKTQNSLKLKRTKPLMNPNSTLQSFMNIKIV